MMEKNGKTGRGRPRLTFENTVSKILDLGHVKSMKSPWSSCMKRLMTVETVAFGAPVSLTTSLEIKREASLV